MVDVSTSRHSEGSDRDTCAGPKQPNPHASVFKCETGECVFEFFRRGIAISACAECQQSPCGHRTDQLQ